MAPRALNDDADPKAKKRSLTDLPLDRPVATLMALLSLMVLGAVAIFELPLDFMPTVEAPFVIARVDYPGSHPLENLRQIVEPLEAEIATVSEIKSMGSSARSGSAEVRAEFDWSVDLDIKKLEVREAVDRVLPDLPADIGRVQIVTWQDGPGDGAILEARIAANRDLAASWELLELRIRRPLERIRGVARVSLDGVEPQQVRIEIDPAALQRHGVEPRDLVAALEAAHLDLDAGAVHGDALRYDVRSVGRFATTAEIEALPLPSGNGAARTVGDLGAPTSADGSRQLTRLGDVATVAVRQPRISYGRHLDRKSSIALQVFKEPTANTVETIDALMARVDEIRHDPELAGIQLLVWNNAGTEIRNSLSGLRDAGAFGGVLVILVLWLFLRHFVTTLVVAVAIPFSLLVTCGVLFLTGGQLNVLTMLGLMLGVGMLVDNAVVVIENIYRLQGEGLTAAAAARRGAREIALAVLASTATTICVWSWLLFADPGPMKIYLGQVAFTICVAVTCSLLISLAFIPLAASRFAAARTAGTGFVASRLVPAYRRLLGWTLHHRVATLVLLAVIAASAAYPIAKINKSAEPTEREVYAQIFLRSLDPTTRDKMEGHINKLEDWVEANRDKLAYDSLYSWFDENGFAIVRLYLDPGEATAERIAALVNTMREGAPRIPGVELEFGERQWWRRGGQERRMVSVALHGEDPEYLADLAAQVEGRLRPLDDVIDVWGPSAQGQQEARVLVDPEKARQLGVSPRQVAETVGLTYRGRNLRRFQRAGTELEMLVALPDDLQPGVASLDSLPIPREGADPVPLGAVAEVQVARLNEEINRENRQTSAWVTAEFETSVPAEEAKGRVKAALDGLVMPEGYVWDWGEWGRRHQDSLDTMMLGVALSLAVVLLLMAALFESLIQPLAIFVTLPLAFFGAFWALWTLGYDLDVVGFMGVIILIGIVVNNGIVMVDHVNQLRAKGLSREEALVRGCGDRLRPILMTAISTLVGLVPLAMSQFTVATAYVDSLAVSVIGGLSTSTFFTLIGLPVWYATVEDVAAAVRSAMPRRVGVGEGGAKAAGGAAAEVLSPEGAP